MNLEDRFFYRLVKAMHYFGHGIFILGCILILFFSFPKGDMPDNTKSYIICDNGKTSEPVSNAGMEIYSYNKELSFSDEKEARKFCATDSNKKVTDPVMQEILNGNLPDYTELKKNYRLKIIYQPRNWTGYLSTFCWCFVMYAIFYIITNIVSESLIYVAFGRKFTWTWLKIIIISARKIFDASKFNKT